MRTIIFSLAFLCTATCLSAQSISDSLRLEIISIVPNNMYNNYDVNISIENRTKEFSYSLFYSPLNWCDDPNSCWRVRFEVEYKDGTRDTCQAAGIFFMEDLKKASRLMPGERRRDTMPLFCNGAMHGDIYAISTDGEHTLSDVKRIRFFNGRGIVREPMVRDEKDVLKGFHGYRECTVASNWYNIDFW